MEVIWSTRARECLRDIGRYIARDNPVAARRWVSRLVARAESIVDAPLAGRIVPEFGEDDLRELIERNYRIVYRVQAGAIHIVFVFEGHRLLRASEVNDE